MKIETPTEFDVTLEEEEIEILSKAYNILSRLNEAMKERKCESYGIDNYDGTEWHGRESLLETMAILDIIPEIEKIG